MSNIERPLTHPGEILKHDILPALGLEIDQAAAKVTIDPARFKDFLDGNVDLSVNEAQEVETQFQLHAHMIVSMQQQRADHKAANSQHYALDQVPDTLKTKYVPVLKVMFNKYAEYMTAVEASPIKTDKDPTLKALADDYLAHSRQVYDDFRDDGGTEEQWNILAPAVHYGHFGP